MKKCFTHLQNKEIEVNVYISNYMHITKRADPSKVCHSHRYKFHNKLSIWSIPEKIKMNDD